MKKWLLFTNGGGSSDPLNWDSSEAALYSSEDLKTIKPSGPRTLDLLENGTDEQKLLLGSVDMWQFNFV